MSELGEKEIRALLREILSDKGAIRRIARGVADDMACLLRQEYKLHKGQWWLFTLGLPARPLKQEEIADAQVRGDIPSNLA